jgi:GNAT superfamily N-acetyltransferase
MELLEGYENVDFSRVHPWLTNSYWCPGISLEKVQRAARGSSLLISAYEQGEQVGYTRIISDKATFAWVCDVYVAESARGKGIAEAMVRYAQEHPEHQGLRRWVLATRDAHRVYEKCAFEPLWEPSRWMIYWPAGSPNIPPPP